MPFAKNDNVVETLAPNASEKPLDYGIHQRRSDCGLYDLGPSAVGGAIEISAKLVITIANEKLRPFAKRRSVAKLLRRPLLRRIPSDTDMNHSFGIDIDDEERKNRPKPDVVDLQEVAGPYGVVSKKRMPTS